MTLHCILQGVSKAFSKAYHKLDVRQKLARMCRHASPWLIHICSRVRAVDVYLVAVDVARQCPVVYRVSTTSGGRVTSHDDPPAIRHKDNLFQSVSFLSSCCLMSKSLLCAARFTRENVIALRLVNFVKASK